MCDNLILPCGESCALLQGIGIPGEILHTLGHSDDSVSLLLDDGSAFTGDLVHPAFARGNEADVVSASWRLLRERGATRVHPAHGPVRLLEIER